MSVRGRVQVEWRGSTQTRANNQRDWLNGQLTGRGYVATAIPKAFQKHGVWTTLADIGFNTVQEGDTVKTICLTRQNADPTITAGSFVQWHECPHDDNSNGCSATLTRTVK